VRIALDHPTHRKPARHKASAFFVGARTGAGTLAAIGIPSATPTRCSSPNRFTLPPKETDMTTLTIKDLSSTETLDATTLKSVRGGLAVFAPRTSIFTPVSLSFDSHKTITQSNQQMQQVENYFANGSAFQDHMTNNVYTNQSARNNAY
jgi:hypothetical protein